MPRRIDPTKRKLTDIQCRNAKPQESPTGEPKPIKLSDGYGLNLEIHKNGKFWFYAFRLNGKQLKLNLGSYPNIGLSEVRQMHEAAWQLVKSGQDPRKASISPLHKRRTEIESQRTAVEEETRHIKNSFQSFAEEWLRNKESSISWDTARRRDFLLRNQVFPVIGHRQIGEIRVGDIVDVLQPISDRGSTYQAKRCRQILQQIFNNARALELCEINPAEAIRHADVLPTHQGHHYNALEFSEMGPFLRALRDPTNRKIAQARPALELLVLTAVRPGNVCSAHWENFTLDGKHPAWLIPAAQMKKRRDHIVPLSKQAVKLLENIRSYNWDDDWLLPGTKRQGLSDGTLKKQLGLLGYEPQQVHPHGFRSTFSTHANESSLWNRDSIEWALAHVETNEVRSAYNRAQYLEERRKLLQWWADELDQAEVQ